MSREEFVRQERNGECMEIVLDRPEKLNALTDAMIAGLSERLKDLTGVRVLLMWGEGRAFCAGRDISAVDPSREDAALVIRSQFTPLFRQLRQLPIPTIAAVQGACMGAGLGLAMACDVVLVAPDAVLAVPFGRLGAVLDSGGHYDLVRQVGFHRAMDLIYSGQPLSGEEAQRLGLASRTVPAPMLVQEARQYAMRLASGPTQAYALSKRIAQMAETADWAAVVEAEAWAQGEASRTSDYREGFQAFRDKRSPSFRGQ